MDSEYHHGQSSFSHDVDESSHELYENIEELETKEHESQVVTKNTLVGVSQKLVSIFPYAATFFVQQLTVNDRPDINFISLLLSYLLQLAVILILKIWIVSNEKATKSVITSDLYDVAMDTFLFAVILYSVILIRLISSYFNFTMDDTFTIIVIFILLNLFVRLFIRISSQGKYSIQ
jgi:hypothetical protein